MVNVNCDDKEWIRRRQMRIMQVRKQSNDIAKRLRERVINEEHQRRVEEKNLLDTKLHLWKVKRLKTLEEMYRKAISDFGTGHKMATEKPNPVKEVKEKHKEYLCRAKKRGQSALELELKEKKEAAEKKQIPIQRKMITRKIEDLRSSLICSIPVKEPSVILRDIYAGKTFDPKKFENSKFEENIKKNSRQEEKIQKKEAQPVKSSSEECFVTGKICPGKFQRKTRKKTVKQIMPKSGVISDTNKEKTSKVESPRCQNNWVNLGAIEILTKEEEETVNEKISKKNLNETESEKGSRKEINSKEKEKVLKSDLSTKKVAPVKQKPVIECHGVSLRHNCKLKDSIYVVQKSQENISEPNAIELALKEEEKLLLEKNEKEIRENAAEERGNKALEKQKIIKNYNELLMKLEKLSTKEKLIKSYCHIPPAHMFLSDERRKEKSARKQRIMDSEFERIYYDVTGAKPDLHLNTRLNLGSSIEEKTGSESGSVITKLDFSKLNSNLKTNSLASSAESISKGKAEANRIRSPVEKVSIKKTPSSFHFKRTKMIKGNNKALLEIDRILKKCQELRQESRSDVDPLPSQSGPECSEKKADLNLETESISCKSTENGSVELQFCKSDTSSLCEGNRVSDINDLKRDSPRKNLSDQEKAVLEDLAMGDVPRNFIGIRNNITAWPLHEINRTKPVKRSSGRSSSTSYRSLPTEIRPKRINSLLRILATLKEREGRCTVADELIVELENLLSSLVHEAGKNNLDLKEKDCQDFENNPRLNYYISKLLDMSRETIAELSLLSESETSCPQIPAFCDKEADRTLLRAGNKYLKQINDNSRISRITRAKELEEIIKNWKFILEQNLNFSIEDDFSQSEIYENGAECTREEEKKNEEKYEDIAKICSDRMAVLSLLTNGMNKGYKAKPDQEYGETQCERDKDIQGLANIGHNYVACIDNKNFESFSCPKKENKECPGSKSSRKKRLDYCDDYICPFRVPLNEDNVNCQEAHVHQSADNSLESLPNVMEELLKKKIITSPFQWSQGNVLSDSSPKGSCHSRKSKGSSIHEEIKHINQVNKLPEKNEQECAKPKVNNCLYQPYRCKNSCKGSCATGTDNFMQEAKQSSKNRPVPEKIVQENVSNFANCVAEFPTKVINRPRKRKGPASYRDAAYGIFSPVPHYYRARSRPKPTNVSPEICPAHPHDLFKKKTFASRYIWDEDIGSFMVNPNEGVPVARRPFWEPHDEAPKSPGIKFTSVKKKPEGYPKRPRSSPVRGYERGSGREDCTEPPVNPCKILHFDEESFDPYFNLIDLQEPENDIMEEWIRRNMASKLFNTNAGNRDFCAGSCAVHCNNDYNSYKNRPRSSCSGGYDRVENCQRAATSSPDVRGYGRAPIQDEEFSPIRYEYEEEYGEDEYEDSEDCAKYYDLKWGQDLLQDLNERN